MEPEERARDLQAVERRRILICTLTPTQACRSSDQACEVRKGYRKMGPGSLGGKELDPSGWERRSYLRAEVQDLQTIEDFMA